MGWEDAPIVTPAAPAAPVAPRPWENAPVVYAAPKRIAQGVLDAVSAGYQGSVVGLATRGKLPDVQLDPVNSKWYERLAAGATQLASEFPLMVVGGVGGAAGGGVVGGVAGTAVPVVGNAVGAATGAVVGGGAGAFALPAAIRESYIQAYSKGELTGSADFLSRAAIVLKHTGKEAVVGAATAGAGRLARMGAETVGLGAKATGAAVLGAEGTTLVVAPAMLEGRLPEPQDFTDAALLLVGLKGVGAASRKLGAIYAKTGKTPTEVMADAAKDPTIVEDLRAEPPQYVAQDPTKQLWQHQGAEMKGLTDKPMYFSVEGDNFWGRYNTHTEFTNLPITGKMTGHLEFKKPLVESQLQPGEWDAIVAKAVEQGADPVEMAKWTKSWVKNGEFGLGKPDEIIAAAKALGYDGIVADVSLKSPHAIAFNPAETLKVVDDGGLFKNGSRQVSTETRPGEQLNLFSETDIPRAYKPLAREEMLRNTIGDQPLKIADVMANPQGQITASKEPNHVNYRYVEGPEDVKAVQAKIAEVFQAEIEAKRGTESWTQTQEKAAELLRGRSPEELAGKDFSQLAAEAMAQQALAQKAAFDLAQVSSEIRAAGANVPPELAMRQAAAIETLAMLHAIDQGNGAAIARALNARKAARETSALGKEAGELLAKYSADPAELARLVGELGTAEQMSRFAEKASKATLWEKVVEAWKAGLVSGPITQTANILGNVTFMATRPLVDAVAVVSSNLRRADERMSAVEPLARVIGNINGTIDGSKAAWAVLKTGELSGKTESRRKAIEGPVGEIVRVPFRLLSSADAFFRVTNERGEAYALATREAAKEGYNPATREYRERVAELVSNPPEKMLEQIDTAGERFTFNAPLGEKGRAIQATIKKLHLEWAVPFVQTPANVAKEMLRLTPAAPIVKEWRDAISKGGAEADKAVAEMVIGTAVGTTVFAFALSGNISGQGDPDPRKRATQMASGWQPYSIKVGDQWHSYQRLQPVGTLIGMAADAATVWDHANEDESDKIPKIMSTAFANAITNQTFLQGVTQIVNAISDPERFGPKFAQNMAASTIPAVVGQTAQMMDPYQREVYSILDAIQNRIPGLREDLMPKRDPYGEPVAAKDRLGEISPITTSTMSTDKVRLEAARLGVGVAKAPKDIELPAGRDPKLGKVELTPQQRDIFADKAGHFAHQILTQIVNMPGWETMPNMTQRQVMEKVFESSRKMGKAAAVPPEQIIREAQRISNELQLRLQPKPLSQ